MMEDEYTLDDLNAKVSKFKEYLMKVVKKNNTGISIEFSTETRKSCVTDEIIDVKVLSEIKIVDL